MSAVAIIPARGGSKRIPRKNIKPFHGRPMLAHSIQAALDSGLFARVVVSTDDAEIAAVARDYGAEVPFLRPAALADDHTGTVEVIQHAVAFLREQGEVFAYACCLYATAPFVTAADLTRGLELLAAQPDKAYAFSVTDYAAPVQRALRLRPDGGVESLYPQFYETRSQDLEPAFHDAGQFYWGRVAAWGQGAPLHAPHSLPVRLPRHRVQDIDTPEDWQRAEALYGAFLAGTGRPCVS
ncbi:pseudaminic acid cytidylyltransferase [Pseudomonas rhizoryzae]|uniref:pseudaminic acid cytidylyltransferase n=1 Tax=Pseudomonas rhizoryzae TaxID=2571129 RepID=UPI0007360395|nr:pseudaminic acid cytidylyltransferase [Pseudomonas rhizoryzae]KTT28699.1 NeuA [Pseudomonas psychrotolerans]KTT35629.1 NeuA [Pseudomonas psychrotolerans]KTT71582.1 NeuA [Pseudomonas psychrotolerans]